MPKQSFIKNKFSSKGLYDTLFSVMSTSAELYLSKFSKPKKALRRKGPAFKIKKKNDGIEKLLEQENSDTVKSKLKHESVDSKYAAKPTPFARFIKNLYGAFVNYGNKSYQSAKSNYKKIDGFVKMSMEKFIKVHQYIMALVCPQWNRVTGSPEDKDTLAPTVTQKESIDSENTKYEFGYQFLRYQA
jgi:hypothetical protein